MTGSITTTPQKVVQINEPTLGFDAFIVIDRYGKKRHAFGATRIWKYSSKKEALEDAVKLAKIMSYKCAIAGLPYGGAKGVILPNKNTKKELILKKYVGYVNSLKGKFITGADVGLSDKDVKVMKKASPYIVGSTIDPVHFTAIGVKYGIQIALEEIFGSRSLKGRTVAIQGLGKIGFEVLRLLVDRGVRLTVSDLNLIRVKKIKKKYPNIKIIEVEDIHRQKVDVFCPCAVSNCINKKTVSELRCKIVAGGANRQLETERDGIKLFKKGILYAPDYIINAGGLISVVDEYENKTASKERVAAKIYSINKALKRVFIQSKKGNKPHNIIADKIAERIIYLNKQ